MSARIDLRERDDLHDPQDAPIRGYCVQCGGEVYMNEPCCITTDGGELIHDDCAKNWLFQTQVNNFLDFVAAGDCYAR